jgi:hypothetical protein
MADILTQALLQSQQNPQTSPWSSAGAQFSQQAGQYMQSPQYADDSPTSRLVAALISGVGGAALQGYGAYDARQKQEAINNDLLNVSKAYYGGGDLTSIGESVQSPQVRGLLPAIQIERMANTRAAEADRASKVQALRDTLLYSKGIDVAPEGSGARFVQDPSMSDIDFRAKYKDALATRQAQVDAESMQGVNPKELASTEDSMRNELYTKGSVADLRQIDNAYKSMVKSYNDKSGASDLDLIYGTAKTLDPMGSVREGDAVMIQRTDGYFGQLQAFLGSVQGGAKLSPENRRSLLEVAGRRRDEAINAFNTSRDELKGIANRRGANFENINAYGDFQPSNALVEALKIPSASPASAPVKGPDGNMYIINRGPDGQPISKTRVN